MKAKVKAAVQKAKEGVKRAVARVSSALGAQCDDEEKASMLRQPEAEPVAGPEPDLDTTMEEEIAQFRAAVNVVGEMVAAEEGRARRMPASGGPPVPPRPRQSAFTEFVVDYDEDLPAYEARRVSLETSLVSDGFQYTPGSTIYTPGSTIYTPSTGSDSSVRGGGADDVLGDTKH